MITKNKQPLSAPGCLMVIGLFMATLINSARAGEEVPMPEGMVGWWYFISALPETKYGYAKTAMEACQATAHNHFQSPLYFMTPSSGDKPAYQCGYKHNWINRVEPYSPTQLVCKAGYSPRWPGVCTKWVEAPHPATCSGEEPGTVEANPVVVSSGAKLQTETDFPGLPNGALRVTRTYRTFRETGNGQSAGRGWSFSFDRDVTASATGARRPYTVSGAAGDGSYFEFEWRTNGLYKPSYGKRETLQSMNDRFDEWLYTTEDGDIERLKRVDGKFLLVSTHTKEGAGQFYSYGASNKLETITDANGRTLTVTWNGDEVASITGAEGSVRYEYETARINDRAIAGTARLMAVHFYDSGDQRLGTRRYHYDDADFSDLLTGITDENGVRFATYAYNRTGQAILSEHAGGANRYTFAYPEKRKRSITDPLGATREYGITYLSSGSPGRITDMSQPAGSGCGPGSSALVYDLGGSLASKTDFNERKTCYLNDATRGLETSRVSGLGKTATCPKSSTAPIPSTTRRISTQWHPEWKLETAVAGPKLITNYVYNGQRDSTGNVVSCAENATLPDGKPIAVLCAKTLQATSDTNGALGFDASREGKPRTWSFTYNARGQLLTRTGPKDALGQSESIIHVYYDESGMDHSNGDLASTTNGVGEVTRFLEYTEGGLATRIEHPNGTTTFLRYAPRQRLMSSTVADGKGGTETTHYSYDDAGQITRIVAPDESSISYSYDEAHRLIGLTDSQGDRVSFKLDSMGNAVHKEVRDNAGKLVRETIRQFDALNRITMEQGELKSPMGSYLYDRSGNMTALMNGKGAVSHREFDNLDRPMKETLAPSDQGITSGSIAYEYDQQDRLIGVIDPRRLSTKYARDGFGQRTEMTSPDTGLAQFTFDGAGNLASTRDARGFTTPLLYDAAKRVTRIGTSVFEYGKAGPGGTGGLISMTDESGQTKFEYDEYGRLRSKAQMVRTGTKSTNLAIAFDYGKTGNSTGHVASFTYPSGNRVVFTYDPNGQATSAQLFRANSVEPISIVSNVKYAPWGAVQSWTWGNDTGYRRTFDTLGRITRYPLGHAGFDGIVRNLAYDDAGRIASMKHAGTPQAVNLDQVFSYDDQNRLTRVEAAGVSQSFDYDQNGNRIRARFGTTTYLNTIDASSNRLLTTTGPAPSCVNSYDSAGNLISDGKVKYTYGADGRVTEVENAGIRTEYKYNGLGQRVLKVAAGSDRTYFMFDAEGRIIGEYDADGKTIQETIFLADMPIAVFKPGAATTDHDPTPSEDLYHVFSDHIATPRVITSATSKRAVWRWESVDPFGVQQPEERPGNGSPFIFNSRFPGQTFDKETNSHYNYFRNYDPRIGRYIESDPIGLKGGTNTYSYVNGNPVTGFDPFGLDDWGRVGRGAIVYTHMAEGYTVMYDQATQEFLMDIPTSNKITRTSLPGANLPYSGAISANCQIGALGIAFGNAKVRTGDPRSRWVHGGGSDVPLPYAPRQGWAPTRGCTRAQNEDVLTLCAAIAIYREEHPGAIIPYRRD